MYHRLRRKKPQKLNFSLRTAFVGLVLCGIIGGSGYLIYRALNTEYEAGIHLPKKYNQPVVLKTKNYQLAFTPLAAQAARAQKSMVDGTIKNIYKDAYQNTDVEQIVEGNRIKENIIFKSRDIPQNLGMI